MKEVFVICKMMEAEARAALIESGSQAEVVWMEKGLHTRPERLNAELQKTLERVELEYAPDRVLLGYGFCGNAVSGLRTGNFELVMPRIDDCITLFIGSRARKAELEGGVGTMFQTSDWTDLDEGLAAEKRRLYEDFDEDEADDLFKMMYGNYKRIAVLDTHCFDMGPVLESSRAVAAELGFEHCVFDASNQYLVELLSGGPFDEERFIVKGPDDVITPRDLWM